MSGCDFVLHISVSDSPPCYTIALNKLSLDSGSKELVGIIKYALRFGERNFVIEMPLAKLMDSSGIGSMVECFRKTQEAGARIRYVVSDRSLLNILKRTKLDTVLPLTIKC